MVHKKPISVNRRATAKKWLFLAAGAAILPVLVGCSATLKYKHELEDGTKVFIDTQSWDAEMAALLEGTLAVDAQGCLIVTNNIENTADAAVIFFPYGTKIDGNTIILGAKRVTLGDHISLGGGGGEIRQDSEASVCEATWMFYAGGSNLK